jgi:hypothetical protein
MYARHADEGGGASFYGYGWAISDAPWGGRAIAHNGGNGVFYADFLRFPDDDLVVILFTNDSTVRGGRIASGLARLAHGDDVPPPTPAGERESVLRALGTTGRDAVVRAWFDAFNAPDLSAMRELRQNHSRPLPGVDDAERDRRLQSMRDDLGSLDVAGVVAESDQSITVRATSPRGLVARLEFEIPEGGKLGGVRVEVGN